MNIKSEIQTFWKDNPMTYAEIHGQLGYQEGIFELGTQAFFDQVDNRFYSWNMPLHKETPFDKLFPYSDFRKGKILEIGCGMGTMLMNWAKKGAHCTGVDLNPTSIAQTKNRFKLNHLQADLHLEDANHLSFLNNQFDYVYSWGVLHHSPNLELSIKELFRVLKPGGGFGIMLYNRHSFYQWYMTDFIEGFLHNERQWLTPLELNSRYGDGHQQFGNPYTWPITKNEGLEFIRPYSKNCKVKILGTDLDCVLTYLMPGFGKYLPVFLKKSLARRWGWSLWFYGQKGN